MEHTEQIQEWMKEDLKYLKSVFCENDGIAIHYEIDTYHNGIPTTKPLWIFLHSVDKPLIHARGDSLKMAIESIREQLKKPTKEIWDLL